MQPWIIGIAGGSASGKSTLAEAIAAAVPGVAPVIEQDWYYRSQDHLSIAQRLRTNYDHPDAIEMALLAEHLAALKRGSAVHAPRYDFTVHTRTRETTRIDPAPVVIVAGLHVLADARLRGLLDLGVYVDTPPAECLARRIARDVAERGRDAAGVRRQFAETVQPMHAAHVAPSRVYAHLIVSGMAAVEYSVARLLERVPR